MARLTIDDVKRLHRAAGKHFFDADTMRFWGTTMVSELFPNNTFVTGDDNYDRSKKMYTVRLFDEDTAEIETVCGFQRFDNFDDAVKAAKAYGTEEDDDIDDEEE